MNYTPAHLSTTHYHNYSGGYRAIVLAYHATDCSPKLSPLTFVAVFLGLPCVVCINLPSWIKNLSQRKLEVARKVVGYTAEIQLV